MFLERDLPDESITLFGQLGIAFGDSIIPDEIRNDLTTLLKKKEEENQVYGAYSATLNLKSLLEKRASTEACAEQILPVALASLSLIDKSSTTNIDKCIKKTYLALMHRLVAEKKIKQAYKLYANSFVKTDLKLDITIATAFLRVIFRTPGGWEDAFEFYKELKMTGFKQHEMMPDLIFYHTLFTGMIYAGEGHGNEAQEIQADIEKSGIELDDVFYLKLVYCALNLVSFCTLWLG
jgi:hypothetical protein